MTLPPSVPQVQGIAGGSFYGKTIGNVNGNVDARSYSTYVSNIYLLAGETLDPADIARRVGEWETRWEPFVKRLLGLPLSADRQQLVAIFVRLNNPLFALPDVPDEQLFPAIVNQFAFRPPPGEAYPLLVFVEALARDTVLSETQREALRTWLRDASEFLKAYIYPHSIQGGAVAELVQDTKNSRPALLIALEPDGSETLNGLRLRAWVWLAPGMAKPVATGLTGTYTIDQIEQRLPEVYAEARKYFASQAASTTVEFILPRAQLSTPVHEWKVLTGDPEEEVWVCIEHQVMVRPWERNCSQKDTYEQIRSRWRAKWQRQCEHDPELEFFKPRSINDYIKSNVLKLLLRRDTVVGYGETLKLPENVDHAAQVLKAVIEGGLPIAVWLRNGNNATPAVLQRLDGLAEINQLKGLREEIRKLRQYLAEACALEESPDPLGAGLVLLWDDPDRLPDRNELFVAPVDA